MIDGSNPALPLPVVCNENGLFETTSHGLSIREEFAARAMQGILTSLAGDTSLSYNQMKSSHFDLIAESAVKMADSLISELNK